MNILKRIPLAAAGLVGIPFIFFSFQPLELKSTLTTNLFKDEKYSLSMLKFLLRFSLLQNTGSLNLESKILKYGFDSDGSYLRGCELIGLSGLQIGPISLDYEQTHDSFGVLYVKSNINTFLQKFHSDKSSAEANMEAKKKRIKKFKIGVNLSPSQQVLEFTPYLIPQNLSKCLEKIANLYDFKSPSPQTEEYLKKEIQKRQKDLLKQNHMHLDFASVSSDQICQKLGSEVKVESEKMIKKFLTNAIISSSSSLNIALYEEKNSQHNLVYRPSTDKTGLDDYSSQYKFIGWRDIIKQIINN